MEKQAFNPYLPLSTYIPDGEPHVFDGRVYVYGSHDQAGGKDFCLLDYECWSAPVDDLGDWRREGTIYRAPQCPHYKERGNYLYAPDVVRGPDGRYYLYYDLAGSPGHGFDGPISVAVCDTPAGRYEYYGDVRCPDGRPLLRYIPFDPAVLNDDGRIFLTYGWGLGMDTHSFALKLSMPFVMSRIFNKPLKEIREEEPHSILGANIVELEPDMLTVKGEPKRILPARNNAPKGSGIRMHSFYEASSLRKFGDLYYFIWSSHVNHELCYATSRYPDRGYEYRGVIVSNGDIGIQGRKERDRLYPTGTNHGSIEEINGKHYVFYHRQTHNTAFSRQGCAEEIAIGPDGSIRQAEMTSCGLNGGPLKGEGRYPAAVCCNLTNGRMPHLSNVRKNPPAPNVYQEGEEVFIRDIEDGTLIGYKYFLFDGEYSLRVTTRGAGGTLSVKTQAGKEAREEARIRLEGTGFGEWRESQAVMISLQGIQPVYFLYEGSGRIDFLEFEFCKQAENAG